MRRTSMIVAVIVGSMLVAAPASASSTTILVERFSRRPNCGARTAIAGHLTNPSATPRVVLEHAVRGNWVDWKQPPTPGTAPVRVVAAVDPASGTYKTTYLTPPTAGIIHLRFRTNGGSVVSRSIYISVGALDTGRCA
jgi:hypothetical protein